MRVIGYILSGVAFFLIGLAVFLRVKDDKERKARINASTAKAREAKAEKALLKEIEIDQSELDEETSSLLNKTQENNASKKEKIER